MEKNTDAGGRCEIISGMKDPTSSFALANLALQEGRREDAVLLYAAARESTPELGTHIDFNLGCFGRQLQGEEKSPIVVASTESELPRERIPAETVLVIVVAESLEEAGQTARLLSRRASVAIGIVVLIKGNEASSMETSIGEILGATKAKYSLIVKAGTFPGAKWLESAYTGLADGVAEAVYANAGCLSGERPLGRSWLNLFALTSALRKEVLGQNRALEYRVEIDFLLVDVSSTASSATQLDPSNESLHILSTPDLHRGDSFLFTKDVCVVMPCIDLDAGRRAARLLIERSGLPADFVLAVDTGRQGFIPTLNQVARRSSAQYIVYLAQDAWPGDGWLLSAYDRIRQEKKSLLAFNCGKWHGRVAAFGMVEKSWAYSLYGDEILYGGYQSHRADNELTVIARAQDRFVYAPECVLVENDSEKVFRRSEREASHFRREDARLFRQRFRDGFCGLADRAYLKELHDEYLNLSAHYATGAR